MTQPKPDTTLSLIREALQDAICWEQSRVDAGVCSPQDNNLKKYEKLLSALGHVTRAKAFAQKLKADGSKLVSVFDLKPFMEKLDAE